MSCQSATAHHEEDDEMGSPHVAQVLNSKVKIKFVEEEQTDQYLIWNSLEFVFVYEKGEKN